MGYQHMRHLALHLDALAWSACSRMEQLSRLGDCGTHTMITSMSTRTIRKTAIALPTELLSEVDRAARDSGESRSRYITRILQCAVRARRHAAITRRLDELFADPALAEEQRRTAAELDAAGASWNDERW